MKVGDIILFNPPYFIRVVDGVFGTCGWDKKLLGLLIKYEPREKMTTVMYDGELLRVPIRKVKKLKKNKKVLS